MNINSYSYFSPDREFFVQKLSRNGLYYVVDDREDLRKLRRGRLN